MEPGGRAGEAAGVDDLDPGPEPGQLDIYDGCLLRSWTIRAIRTLPAAPGCAPAIGIRRTKPLHSYFGVVVDQTGMPECRCRITVRTKGRRVEFELPDDALGLLSPAQTDLAPGEEGNIIVSVETYALAVPLVQPLADSTAALKSWIVPVVEIRTADGRVGTGISGVHCGPELLCHVIDRYYARALVGSSSEDILGTWKRLYWLPTHWIGRAGVVHMALSMVDIALWDLAAQRAGLPLWRLLGGSADPIETYNTDGGWLNLSVAEVVRDLGSLIDRGWRRVKIKVGTPDWREDASRVRAVRKAVGPDITVMADANQRWDLATAQRILPALAEAELDWIEEPVHADDLGAHQRLQAPEPLMSRRGEACTRTTRSPASWPQTPYVWFSRT